MIQVSAVRSRYWDVRCAVPNVKRTASATLRALTMTTSPPEVADTGIRMTPPSAHSVEQLTLHGLMRDLIQRLSAVESAVAGRSMSRDQARLSLTELTKVLLTSWASFAFV